MVSAGILGLVFILLVVFCIIARKTWNWIDITFVILCFMVGTAAIWGATSVYSQRKAQLQEVEKWEKQLAINTEQADKQIFGDPTSLTYDPGTLRAVTGELSRELTGRGRVWSGGTLAADGNNKVFNFSTPRPDVADRPLLNVVVYAFLENQNYPALYVGSVRIKAESAESVTIAPVALAEAGQFENPTGTWTLFEKMPLDRRGSFKAAAIELLKSKENLPEGPANLLKNLEDPTAELDIAAFRQFVQTNFLKPELVGFAADSIEYEKFIDHYVFDGLSLGKITNWIQENSGSRKSTSFEPLPEEVFVKFRFDKKSSRKYAVDANGSVENDGLFTPLGLAVDEDIKAGKEVEFNVNDTVLVDQRTALGYQRSPEVTIPAFTSTEAVTEVDKIFIRQNRDFPYEFADLREQTRKMLLEAGRVTQANLLQAKTLADAKTQFDSRLSLTADLESDEQGLQNDLATIQSLFRDKSDENNALKQQIALLESKIDEAYGRLRRLSISLSRRAFAGQ